MFSMSSNTIIYKDIAPAKENLVCNQSKWKNLLENKVLEKKGNFSHLMREIRMAHYKSI